MKKVVGLIVSLIVTLSLIIGGFELYYKASVENFVNERSTIIYCNKNINSEILHKLSELLEVDISKENGIVKNIKDILFVSQNKIYEENKNGVFVLDLGKYYPIAILEINKYFDKGKNGYYILKKENEKYLEKLIKNGEKIYLKNYRGLFVLGKDEKEIEKIIKLSSTKKSKVKSILKEREKYRLGTILVNQGRERYLGMDMLVLSGNFEKEETINIDGIIYGENTFFQELKPQPEIRMLLNYLGNNNLYISTKNISKLDTFIFRMLSMRLSNFEIADLFQNFFVVEREDIFQKLNGEIILDIEKGNYLFGFKEIKNKDQLKYSLGKIKNISIKEDYLGNNFLLIGNDTFKLKKSDEKMEENQVITGKFTYKNMIINSKAYVEKEKLKIKAELRIDKK